VGARPDEHAHTNSASDAAAENSRPLDDIPVRLCTSTKTRARAHRSFGHDLVGETWELKL
jgi:hypothetical protein